MAEYVQWTLELPWIGRGFLRFVHTDALPIVCERFSRFNVRAFFLDGARVTDHDSFHEEAARTFGFPDWYGANWDAFNDVFRDVPFSHPSAIVWTNADKSAASDLKTFSEGVTVMYKDARRFKNIDTGEHPQIELFFTGEGGAFARPDRV